MFNKLAARITSRLLGRTHFDFDGGNYTVAPGVVNPTVFRASLRFARAALKTAPAAPSACLELGCGCGLAAVALARRGHRVTGVDRCATAIKNTADNARRNHVDVGLCCSDWDTSFDESYRWDHVIANPPFFPHEVQQFSHALHGGPELEAVAAVIEVATRRLHPHGRFLLLTSINSGRKRVKELIGASPLALSSTETFRLWGETHYLDLMSLGD